MFALIALTVVCILTYTFEIVFGLAGTVVLLTVLTWLYDAKTLVIFSTLPQILVACIGLLRSPGSVQWSLLASMLGFAAVGAVLGIYLFYQFPVALFRSLLAATISLFGIYLILAPNRLRLTPARAASLDSLSGFSAALFGISGPIMLTRLMATFPDKTAVRNHAFAFFLALNLFRVGSYIAQGSFTPAILEMMGFAGPFLAVALWFSHQLHFHVRETVFRRVVAWVVLLGGLSLFFR